MALGFMARTAMLVAAGFMVVAAEALVGGAAPRSEEMMPAEITRPVEPVPTMMTPLPVAEGGAQSRCPWFSTQR